MKKECKSVKRSIALALSVMLVGLLVGCGEETEVTPELSSTSEVVSEDITSEEVSESTTEEVSEVVSEEPSEEVSEEAAPEVEFVNFSDFNELLEYATELNQTTIVEFDFSVDENYQAIIPNGSNYTMQLGERLRVIAIKDVESIDAKVENIGIMKEDARNVWVIGVYNSGTDMEVSFKVNYTDGTSEDFTIYVTKE